MFYIHIKTIKGNDTFNLFWINLYQMYKSREMGDVAKEVPVATNDLTEEVNTSRPSIVVHSAVVTDRQKSAKGEGDVRRSTF